MVGLNAQKGEGEENDEEEGHAKQRREQKKTMNQVIAFGQKDMIFLS